MRYREISEARGQPTVMYHGTSASNLRSILKKGLVPSEPQDAPTDRWAPLGGIYFTTDLPYAIKAARAKSGDDPIAIVVAQLSLKSTTPDEDVIEKALVRSFQHALDAWGVDDAFEGDLDLYADHEAHRERDPDEPPFDRWEFLKEFWQTVEDNMAQIAGQPTGEIGSLLGASVETALALRRGEEVDPERWHAMKDKLVRLYPRLRSRQQHAEAGLDIPHNVRLAGGQLGFSGRNKIIGVAVGDDGHWQSAYGRLPVEFKSKRL